MRPAASTSAMRAKSTNCGPSAPLRSVSSAHVFKFCAFATPQIPSCFTDPRKEARVMLKAIVKPFVFRLKADQDAGGSAVAGYYDLLLLGFSKEARKVVLDLGKWNSLYCRSPNCASHDSASDLTTIARTSTVGPLTS